MEWWPPRNVVGVGELEVKIDIGRQKGMAEREGGDGTTGMPAWPKISSVVHRSRPGRQ